ncbi:hypothetical protein [Serratia proteamaculans]
MKEHLTTGLLDTLIHFVKWVDSWKKLLLVLLMAVMLTSGVIAWEYRNELVAFFIKTEAKPVIDEAKLDPEMSALMHDTSAVALIVWSVSMERNYRQALYVRINDKRIPKLEGGDDIVLRLHVRETTEIIRLLDTSVSCWSYAGATNIGMEAIKAGVKWVCATKIPPSYGSITGILVLGFSEQPDNEDFIKVRLLNAAEKIIH